MPPREASTVASLPTREKQSVALSSVIAAAVLTTLKLVVGLLTGSLGILSEAAHSGLDLVAAAVTYVSVRLADRPADSTHPFGHGKIEHLSAFAETGLLLATCLWITVEAVRRLFFHQAQVKPSVWAFAALFASLTVDTLRSRALFRVARKYNSQALEADALHFSTDVYSTSVVILGLIFVVLAGQTNVRWLRAADPIAALVVAGIVVYISLRLGKRTVDALVDAAPEGVSPQIAKAISRVPGVLDYGPIRVRQSGNQLFVDLKLTLESNIPLEHAQSVVDQVESGVRDLFPAADVVTRAAPRRPASSDLVERIRAAANRGNFQIHDVTAYEVGGRVNINLDLEVNPNLSLGSAHDRATALENEIKQEIVGVGQVNIHIEPLVNRVESGRDARASQPAVERKLAEIARRTPGLLDCHSVEAHQVGEDLLVRLHCTMESDLPISQVHDLTEDLKFRFRQAFPQISKISIHAEPKEGR